MGIRRDKAVMDALYPALGIMEDAARDACTKTDPWLVYRIMSAKMGLETQFRKIEKMLKEAGE